MEIGYIVLKQIIVMFLMIAAGWGLYKAGLITQAGSRDMGNLLLYVVMPCVILKSFFKNGRYDTSGLLLSFFFAGAAVLLSILIAGIVFGRRYRMENFGTSFSNAGFMGIPIVAGVLGDKAVFYVTSFIVLINLLQWTYGVVVMTGDPGAVTVKKISRNPVVLSMSAGLLLYFLRFDIPDVIKQAVNMGSLMNAPLAMILSGIYLAQMDLRRLFTDKKAYISSAVRLVAIPLVTVLLFACIPGRYDIIKTAVLIAAAAPVGSNAAIFAQKNHMDYTQAVTEVCLSTLFSIITMPAIMGLAGLLWQQQ